MTNELKKELDRIKALIVLGLPITEQERALWTLYGDEEFKERITCGVVAVE